MTRLRRCHPRRQSTPETIYNLYSLQISLMSPDTPAVIKAFKCVVGLMSPVFCATATFQCPSLRHTGSLAILSILFILTTLRQRPATQEAMSVVWDGVL